jgi:homocysteine S-methyltransferase
MPNWNFVEIIDPAELAEQARQWLANGVRLVGGCCGLAPEHIQALRGAVSADT